MPLSVIGAGFGRTGTLSLKLALEQLGFGPCHHMLEVFAHPAQAATWRAAAAGEAVGWDALLAGYGASVDWPSCHFWRELSAHYPAAKVILTVRSPDSWYESFSATIGKAAESKIAPPDPGLRQVLAMAQFLVMECTFAGRLGEPAHAKAVFNRHNAAVVAGLPSDRLLQFNVAEGWAPLCRFLDRPIPSEPFPRANSREEFWQHMDGPR
jgi:hypothetical protein